MLWSAPSPLFSPSSKNKKNPSPKNSLYFRKWNFLALILKNTSIFSKESFSYISEHGTLHFSAQARKIKKIHPEKAFLILQEMETRKNYLYFRKRNFYVFQEELPKPQKPKFIILLQKML